jgi:hypothetical protein
MPKAYAQHHAFGLNEAGDYLAAASVRRRIAARLALLPRHEERVVCAALREYVRAVPL